MPSTRPSASVAASLGHRGLPRISRTLSGAPRPCRIEPTLAPIGRLLDHCASHGRTRPISLRAFHFAHGGAAPLTLAPPARHFEPSDPLEPAAAQEHADLVADLIVHALENDPAQTAETGPAA